MTFRFIKDPASGHVGIKKKIVLISEGEDDAIFLERVLSDRGCSSEDIEVRFSRGKGMLAEYIGGLVKDPHFTQGGVERICLIADADDDHVRSRSRAEKILQDAGLPNLQGKPLLKRGSLVIGLFLFPGPGENGELEDLVLQGMREDPRYAAATSVIALREQSGVTLKKRSKRIVQIVLALSEGELCAAVGRGIRNNLIDLSKESIEGFEDFLSRFLAL